MLSFMQEAGPWGQTAFMLLVVGLPALLGVVLTWYRRRGLSGAALAAAGQARDLGLPPWRQYEHARDAALQAAAPPSGYLLRTVLLGWAGSLLVITLLNFLGTPSLELFTDIMRGRVELPPTQTPGHFVAYIGRTLLAGSLASMLAVPAIMAAAVGFGFVRGWLLGSPLDLAMLRVIASIDPDRADPRLQAVAEDLSHQAACRWPAAAFLAGPFYWLGRGRPQRGAALLAAWLGLMLAGLAVWFLVGRLVWQGDPLNAGTPAGIIWFHLRGALVGLFVLPVFLASAIRYPGTTPRRPARESAPEAPPPAP
jgi:hypothetical protein